MTQDTQAGAGAQPAPAQQPDAQRLAQFLLNMQTRLGSCREACGDEYSMKAWDDYSRAAALLAAAPAQAWPSECDSPELCRVHRGCAGQYGTKNTCPSFAALNPCNSAAPAQAVAVPAPTEAPIDEPVTKQMIDAGAKAAREYIARTGGNNLTVIYRAMRALAPAGGVSACPAQKHATQLAGQGPTPEELMALSRECTKMPGGLGMHYQSYARAVLARWGAAPAQAQEDAPALEAPAAPEWERVRRGLSMMMMGFASTPGKPLQAAEAALDAATEPGMPLACLRALAAAPQAPAAPADPMDWPLPCDVTVGHGTIGKGCKLRTLVLRMQVLYNLAQQNAPAAPAAPAVDARAARDAAFEAMRNRLCGLQRYSFVLDDDGVVRRAQDRSGNWIEFDDAHELFDPVAVDAAIDAARAAQGGDKP